MLLELIKAAPPAERARLLAAALLPGFADAAIIAIIQAGIHAGPAQSESLFLAFCLALVGQVVAVRLGARSFAGLVESGLCQARIRIAEKIRRAELAQVEKIGAGEIYTRLTQATNAISSNLWSVCVMAQSAVILVCISLYIAYLSLWAILPILLFYGGGGTLFLIRRRQVRQTMRESAADQVELFSYLSELLQGGKEVRLNRRRGDALIEELRRTADLLGEAPRRINRILQQNFLTARLALFALMASVVFVLPLLLGASASTEFLSALLSSAIFMFAPLSAFLRSVPEYERASLATESLQALEARLDHAGSATTDAIEAPAPTAHDAPGPNQGPQHIVLSDLSFAYQDPAGGAGFAIGPVSLEIHRGEIIFFVGGNGSGKTTLLKTLAGLYIPSSGSISVDGVPLTNDNRQAFRENFAAIFTDFHLFKKLYGLTQSSPQQVAQLLQQLQIAHKTAYGDNGFTRTNLSTGQRKRIAMVVALLEDRPLYIFDEWAADQDPEFRHYYYEQLLPDLKRRGKTVLAISHDDRYFHCADRVVTLDYGTVRSIDTFPQPGGANPIVARPESPP